MMGHIDLVVQIIEISFINLCGILSTLYDRHQCRRNVVKKLQWQHLPSGNVPNPHIMLSVFRNKKRK